LYSLLSLSLQAGGVVLTFGFSWLVPLVGIGGFWLILAGVLLLAGVGFALDLHSERRAAIATARP
ncbi:MAG TPA: hypothetical protein VFN16_07295, partial [Saccharospirillum sp.]|nr:hypothetical protein [Saccharospirillum sp.]